MTAKPPLQILSMAAYARGHKSYISSVSGICTEDHFTVGSYTDSLPAWHFEGACLIPDEVS